MDTKKLSIIDKYEIWFEEGTQLPIGNLKRKSTKSKGNPKNDSFIKNTVISNIPLLGFKLTLQNEEDYTVCMLEDPRGFVTHINPENIHYLFLNSNIELGEIQEECIWVRNGNSNWVLPITSNLYQIALDNTNRLAKKNINVSKIPIGSKVICSDNSEYIYLGTKNVCFEKDTFDVICKKLIFILDPNKKYLNVKMLSSLQVKEIIGSIYNKTKCDNIIESKIKEDSRNFYFTKNLGIYGENLTIQKGSYEYPSFYDALDFCKKHKLKQNAIIVKYNNEYYIRTDEYGYNRLMHDNDTFIRDTNSYVANKHIDIHQANGIIPYVEIKDPGKPTKILYLA